MKIIKDTKRIETRIKLRQRCTIERPKLLKRMSGDRFKLVI